VLPIDPTTSIPRFAPNETELTGSCSNFPTKSGTASWNGTARMIHRAPRPKLGMPIRPYFTYVGASLLILLFAADACLPEPKNTRFSKPQMSETLHIRIRSEHKWPEKIVFVSAREPVPPQRKPGLFFSWLRCIGPRSEDIEPQVHAIVDDGVEQGAGRTVICLDMNPEACVSEHREKFRQSLSL
jgi:hypothetical protein